MAVSCLHEIDAGHLTDYTSDSSVMNQDYSPLMKRQTGGVRMSSGHHALEDTQESLRGAKLSRWLDDHQPAQTQPGRRKCDLWVTAVISGTGFYAMTWEERSKADTVRECLATQMEDAPTVGKEVVPRMICAVWVEGRWERAKARRRCTRDFCYLRREEEPSSPQEYWHLSLMEVGFLTCVPHTQLFVVTGELAELRCQANLYFLRRILLNYDRKNSEMAKEYLKELLQPGTKLKVEVFQPWGGRWAHVEVMHGDGYLSDVLVEAGYARYQNQPEQRGMYRAAICSSQDLISASSMDSLASHHTPPQQHTKPILMNYTVPKLMEFISHVMKQRKKTAHLTSGWSALSQAMKAQGKERLVQLPGVHQHRHLALSKYQILLRKLKNEHPHIRELKDIKDSYYKQLEGVFEKWKLNYIMAQKKSDVAIDVITCVFIGFTNGNFEDRNYTNKCKNLETSLTNEATLQHKGQELAQVIVPAVAAKLLHTVERLESSATASTHVGQRPQGLHHFIRSRNITPLTLETLATDILKDLNQYHMRGVVYQRLYPGNVLVTNGHATLRPIDSQRKYSYGGGGWAFERFDYGKPLTKADDVFNFGLLCLWMACKGDKYNNSIIKYYCNMALIKMAMAKDPDQRPLVESLLATNTPIYRSNHLWQRMPLSIYLTEVFSERVTVQLEEENFRKSLEVEACEFSSDLESLLQPPSKEESESENPGVEAGISGPLSPASTEGGTKEARPPHMAADDDSLDLNLSDACP